MIDVHILFIKDRDNPLLMEQTLESLKNEPVNIFIEEGILGRIGLARHNAFQKGTSKFVSYVDSDDLVIPGIFEKMLAVYEESAAGVYCNEDIIDYEGSFLCRGRNHSQEWNYKKLKLDIFHMHHMVMYRRDLVTKYSKIMKPFHTRSEQALNLVLGSKAHFIHLEETGYLWRQKRTIVPYPDSIDAVKKIGALNKLIRHNLI